jgi:methyl-accepting chemotaxis protein
VWKTFVKGWDAWRNKDVEFGNLLTQIQGRTSASKELFVALHNNLMDNRANFHDVESNLDKLVEMNVQYGDDAVKEADAASAPPRALYTPLPAWRWLVLVALGLLILRDIMKQLGGDPSYAADIVRQVADGDLRVEVQLKPGDTSSLLAAMKGMIENCRRWWMR